MKFRPLGDRVVVRRSDAETKSAGAHFASVIAELRRDLEAEAGSKGRGRKPRTVRSSPLSAPKPAPEDLP